MKSCNKSRWEYLHDLPALSPHSTACWLVPPITVLPHPPRLVSDAACLPLRGAFSVHLCSTERDCPVQLPYKVLHPTSYQPGRVGQNSDSYITVYDASRSQSDKSCKPDPTNPRTDRFWCHTQENHFIMPCQLRSTFQDGLTLLTVWYEGLVPYSGKLQATKSWAGPGNEASQISWP